MIRQSFFYGLIMGVADLIPGISGGTCAFVMGFYQELIDSIRSFDLKALKFLFRGEFAKFSGKVNLPFLLPLVTGMVLSLFSFAKAIHLILQVDSLRIVFFATFFGLILGSVFSIYKSFRFSRREILPLFLGSVAAFWLTSRDLSFTEAPSHLWLIFSGSLAASAMLLPGISGSFVLNVMGVYPLIIASLAHLTFSILADVAFGIVLGWAVFSRVIHLLLSRAHAATLATLMGLVIGALHVVWPFRLEGKGVLPHLTMPLTWLALSMICAGAAFVYFLGKGGSDKEPVTTSPHSQ